MMKKIILIPILFLSINLMAQYVVVKPSQLPAASTFNLTDIFVINQGTTTKKLPYSVLNTVLKDTFATKGALMDSCADLRVAIVTGGGALNSGFLQYVGDSSSLWPGTMAATKEGGLYTNSNLVFGTKSSSGDSTVFPKTGGVSFYENSVNTNSVLKATIGSTPRIDMNPIVADGASAIAYTLDTKNDLVTTGAKIISFKTGGAEYAYISRSSITSLGLVRAYSDASNYTYFNSEESIVKIGNVTRTNFKPNVTDGATQVAYLFDTKNALSTAGSKLLSVQNNTVERFRVTPTTTDIGDIAGGNYTTIESDGTIKFNGNATYWRDELSDAVTLQQTGTGISRNVTEATIDYTTASNLNDYMYTNIQLNHDKKSSSVIYPHIHWFQAENHTPNFLLRYRIQLLGGAKTTSWTDYPCNTNVYTYSSGTIHQISYGAGITVNGSLSDIIQFKIYRDNADDVAYFGADPYTKTVSVLAFDVHIECDALGSRTENSK